MTAIEFGLFDWIDRRDAPLQRIYEERLQLLEVADEAGFFCYHLAEHHHTPLGMAPSPGIFLAAAAQRTRRLRFGPLCYLLPLYHPLRLIEEICMLDQLSGGRLEVGVSRGVSPYELGYYGVNPKRNREMFAEAFDVLRLGLTRDRLTYFGDFYRYTDVPIELRPLQQPYPPFWYPSSSPETVPWLGRHGFNTAFNGPPAVVKQSVERYWEQWQAHRADADRLNGHVPRPRIGLTRQLVVAESDAEAEALARAAHGPWFAGFVKLWAAFDDPTVDSRGDVEVMLRGAIIAGSPATVREKLAAQVEATGVNYFIGTFAWGSLTHEQTLRSLRLFAEEVMPAFTATAGRETAALASSAGDGA